MDTKKKYFLAINFLFFILPGSLHSQFILPEDEYTTQRDVDVIRVESDKIDVRGLRARKSSGSKGELELTWTISNKKDNLAVIRSDKVISKLSALQSGKVVSILDHGTAFFNDTILTPGDYYYAVVSYQGLKDENVILKANENFTTSPVHFSDKDLSAQQEFINEIVSDIKAEILDNKSIRIKWVYEPTPNVFLLIYRNTSEISDEAKLKASLRIAVVPSTKNYFDDQDTARGDFFYAITVQNPAGVEKIQLKANKNYSTTPINKTEVLSLPVKSIKAFSDGQDITLSWYDSEPRFTDQSIIYRSQRAILKDTDLEEATIIGRVNQDVFRYTDKGAPLGELFYAVLTQNKQGSVQKQLISNENTLASPVLNSGKPAEEKKEEKQEQKVEIKRDSQFVYDTQAIPDRNRILVSWKPDQNLINSLPKSGMYFHLFRFTQKPESMTDLTTKSYIAKIPLNEDSFYDNPPADGFYYYAIFLTTPKGVMPTELKYGDNLVGPVIYKRTSAVSVEKDKYAIPDRDDLEFSFYDDASQVSTDKLNELLRRTYLQKNFAEAVNILEEYRHSTSLKIRARANFYSAISQYNLGKYEQALELIMEPSVRKVYKDRADFWYKQILEKMAK